jgi:hypothetical protein
MSLSIRGGSTIKNRIITGSSANEDKCPFSVTAYETETVGEYKAYVEDGEINFTSFYSKNGGGAAAAQRSISPNCELALMIIFTSDDYEYKSIKEIYVVDFSSDNRSQYKTQVTDYGDGAMQITMYIPLAYIYLYTPPESPPGARPQVIVKQYWCGNLDFRLYYTTVNGAPFFEFFKTIGLTPGEIPMPPPE